MSYRRRVLLINPRFQLRFAFYVCSWLFALSLIYPMLIYNVFEFIIRGAEFDPLGPEYGKLQQAKHDVLILLCLLQLVFLTMTFLISLFMSHRIAGPLYKLGQALKSLASGQWKGKLHFRKKDHFQELAEEFSKATAAAQEKLERKNQHLQAARAHLEGALSQVSDSQRSQIQAWLAQSAE